MIFPYLLVLAGQLSATRPQISAASAVSGFAGACTPGGPISANVFIAWTLTNTDAATYDILVYENGALIATIGGASTSYSKAVVGQIENGTNSWVSNWTYRIDVVRKSDNVAVATTTTPNAWVQRYGGC